MPEERPIPPPDLVHQSRSADLAPYERAAAQSELDNWYRTVAYPEPAGDDHAPPPGAPASSALLGEPPAPAPAPPSGGTPDRYDPPVSIAGEAVPAELRGALAQAATALPLSRTDLAELEQRYGSLATDIRDAPTADQVLADLARWHGPEQANRIVGAAQAAAKEALAKWPGLQPTLSVLGSDAYAISLLGLAALRRK